MSNTFRKKRISWRLDVAMVERKIRTVTELQRRLEAFGVSISTAQLGRIVNGRPQRINSDLLEALVNVLDCPVSDLLRIEDLEIEESVEKKRTKQSDETFSDKALGKVPVPRKPRVAPLPNVKDEDLTGPKVSPFPIPERHKKT
jgi:DNA-binding Xre family transcriptional regulator